MYQAIYLTKEDKDLHRFVWRRNTTAPLLDFWITGVTFDVSSSFIANMCVKRNTLDFAMEYPNAAKVVNESFYVEDCLTGSDTPEGAIKLHHELMALFDNGGFLLRKWISSDPSILQQIDPNLRDAQCTLSISNPESYIKTLGIERNSTSGWFCLTVAAVPLINGLTKRALISDIAKVFDILGWYSPTIVKTKILLQLLWSERMGWDDSVPQAILQEWLRWGKDSCTVRHAKDVKFSFFHIFGHKLPTV